MVPHSPPQLSSSWCTLPCITSSTHPADTPVCMFHIPYYSVIGRCYYHQDCGICNGSHLIIKVPFSSPLALPYPPSSFREGNGIDLMQGSGDASAESLVKSRVADVKPSGCFILHSSYICLEDRVQFVGKIFCRFDSDTRDAFSTIYLNCYCGHG